MAEQKFMGIVIKKQDFQHDDEIITLLGDDFDLSFVALGTRKLTSKNRIALQLGNLIEVEYFPARLNSKLSKLKRANLIHQPPLNISDVAVVVYEIMKIFTIVQNHSQKLFRSMISSFAYFGMEYNHHIKTFIYFNALDPLGIMPKFNSCVTCGRHDRISDFNFYGGGYLCVLHAKNERSLEFLNAIRSLGQGDFEAFLRTPPSVNQEVFTELITFIREQTFFK